MATIKGRGELLEVTEQVNLTVKFKNRLGQYTTLSSFPRVTIVQPNGTIYTGPTSIGVTQLDLNNPYIYSYILQIPYNGPYGTWVDIWDGYLDDGYAEKEQFFTVVGTNTPSTPNSDGYVHLGDDVAFNYSQDEIRNINFLLKLLKQRLNSDGKAQAKDAFGNVIYVTCSAFSITTLTSFLIAALSDFNQTPYFTNFGFGDAAFINQFATVLVEGAAVWAMASKALIEKGAEYTISDNGINFNPPSVADMLNSQASSLLSHYWDKLKFIKNNMRPSPLGLGSLTLTGNLNPAYKRLRHLKGRRF